jgi:hypothetical protein
MPQTNSEEGHSDPPNNNDDDAEETIWLLNQRLSYIHVRGPSEIGSP